MHPIIANQIGKYENDMLEHLLGLYSQGSSASPDEIEKYFKKSKLFLINGKKKVRVIPMIDLTLNYGCIGKNTIK